MVGPSIRPPHMEPKGLMRTGEPLAAAARRSLGGLKPHTTQSVFLQEVALCSLRATLQQMILNALAVPVLREALQLLENLDY